LFTYFFGFIFIICLEKSGILYTICTYYIVLMQLCVNSLLYLFHICGLWIIFTIAVPFTALDYTRLVSTI